MGVKVTLQVESSAWTKAEKIRELGLLGDRNPLVMLTCPIMGMITLAASVQLPPAFVCFVFVKA